MRCYPSSWKVSGKMAAAISSEALRDAQYFCPGWRHGKWRLVNKVRVRKLKNHHHASGTAEERLPKRWRRSASSGSRIFLVNANLMKEAVFGGQHEASVNRSACDIGRGEPLHNRARDPVLGPSGRAHRGPRCQRRNGIARSRLPRSDAGFGRRRVSAQSAHPRGALGGVFQLRACL